MSHFTLMIIGENQIDQLKPFNKNIEVEPYYVRRLKNKDKQLMLNYYKKNKNFNGTFDECYEKYGNDWDGNMCKKVNGDWEIFTTRNHNSKWDWYEIGGRSAGTLKLKEGTVLVQPANFSWGWEKREKQRIISENRADIAYKKDIANINEIICCALLKDGKWYEEGEIGCCDVTSNENPDWDTEFKKLVSELPDNTLITIVDCHI